MSIPIGNILSRINTPKDLKDLTEKELIVLCDELREFIIQEVSKNPGHFGSSLGVVELTVALHRVFNAPYDKLIWDVGHQAYGHKILTGRRDVFNTNRLYKGISGFPRIEESEYDTFGVGHSTTSISAALGMAIASEQKGEHDRHHIAIIGDGSMTGGMAFEALNHAGVEKANLLVVLNDNSISIDQNVGALREYLTDITTSQAYNKLKDDVWIALSKVRKIGPNTQALIQKVDSAMKTILLKQSNMFESLGFRYFGPVDGHDFVRLSRLLNDIKKIPGPKLLHVITVKGKGFKVAEIEQTKWHHAPGKFDKESGEIFKKECKNSPQLYQSIFGYTLLELAEANDKIIGITPAMSSGCSMNIMMKKYPERVFDVGIAEQHAVTFSAGLATQGMVPFCNVYSSFLQRGYDQIIHDVALQKLPVIFCIDRAGLVGADGATHHGAFDIAYLRCIPNMIVSAPLNEEDLRNLMYTAQLKNNGPFAIRYPRGKSTKIAWQTPFKEMPIGKGQIIKEGSKIAFLSIGHIGNYVIEACAMLKEYNIDAAHYDMRFVKPIDETMLHDVLSKFDKIITVEDGVIMGGFGSAILEFMSENNYKAQVKRLGIPDSFVEHGTQPELHLECGYDPESICKEALLMLNI